ncbi:hypothetical protein ACFFX0_12540 [Citricoccus parietis]|uniref:C2H2-type domain-containing protein n=1 Tax=Citricoccus parietis TaxID=592307 RepID=A0ABV5G000_9MICC
MAGRPTPTLTPETGGRNRTLPSGYPPVNGAISTSRRYVLTRRGSRGVAGRGLAHRDSWVTGQEAPCPALPTVVGGPGVYRAYECRARCARTIRRRGGDRWRHGRAHPDQTDPVT